MPIGTSHPTELLKAEWQDFTPCTLFSRKELSFFATATA